MSTWPGVRYDLVINSLTMGNTHFVATSLSDWNVCHCFTIKGSPWLVCLSPKRMVKPGHFGFNCHCYDLASCGRSQKVNIV